MSSTQSRLVHICSEQDWSEVSSSAEYRPASLDEVGFIHLSTLEQVHLPANRIHLGRTDLVLLYVDADAVADPIRWEPGVPTDPEAMLFPHLYGPLPTAAVTHVMPYLPGPDGRFAPPGPIG
ncbi:DUF952 domain-containing protein [Mycobacterium sp. ACS4331]|uniref:DUF952 domain-containing protein n=1 Tax=Mycobacterium sp. ACS4331 TaxID=1834121 RepID=UPI0007FE9DF1|nr:DUF952 domain-containing protein [Mycobacterium sp. ACS4331]OBF15676.1 glutathione S-transferase [Mycobacterium sp. ACS4331]